MNPHELKRAEQSERDMKAFRLMLRRLAKRWRESGNEQDRQRSYELDDLLDGDDESASLRGQA
jgi:hypothetical protein